jgi:hypothetical protein
MTSQSDAVGHQWYALYVKYRKEHLREELTEAHWHNGWYAGVKIGGLQWGFSDKLGYIMILSGQDANLLFDRIEPAKHRVTRLDLCVDVALIEPEDFAENSYEIVSALRLKLPKYSLYRGTNGGSTLYVGSRSSAQYGRAYDKGVEAGITKPGKLWRFEVEYKKPLADQVYQKLKGLIPGERAALIQSTVYDWYDKRNVKPPFLATGEEGIITTTEQRITTSNRKLAWLRSQVAPSVAELVSAGLGKEVLTSLLLDKRAVDGIFKDD